MFRQKNLARKGLKFRSFESHLFMSEWKLVQVWKQPTGEKADIDRHHLWWSLVMFVEVAIILVSWRYGPQPYMS